MNYEVCYIENFSGKVSLRNFIYIEINAESFSDAEKKAFIRLNKKRKEINGAIVTREIISIKIKL